MMIQNGNRKNTVVHTEIADSLSHNFSEPFCLHLASSLQWPNKLLLQKLNIGIKKRRIVIWTRWKVAREVLQKSEEILELYIFKYCAQKCSWPSNVFQVTFNASFSYDFRYGRKGPVITYRRTGHQLFNYEYFDLNFFSTAYM